MTALYILLSLAVGAVTGVFHVWLCRALTPPGTVRIGGYVVMAVTDVVLTLIVIGDPAALAPALAGAICAYAAWREWRRTRRRRPSRLLGRVRDLGHRLTVLPEPSPA